MILLAFKHKQQWTEPINIILLSPPSPMDSVFLRPKLRSSSFTCIIPHNNNHSLIKPLIPTNFNRIKTPLISSSHSSNPNSSNHNHTINPTFWEIIKRLAIPLPEKWVLISKPHCKDIDELKDLRLLFASGGMPSSHSALCTALTTSVAICHGVADSLFPVCLGFSLIVMFDCHVWISGIPGF